MLDGTRSFSGLHDMCGCSRQYSRSRYARLAFPMEIGLKALFPAYPSPPPFVKHKLFLRSLFLSSGDPLPTACPLKAFIACQN